MVYGIKKYFFGLFGCFENRYHAGCIFLLVFKGPKTQKDAKIAKFIFLSNFEKFQI